MHKRNVIDVTLWLRYEINLYHLDLISHLQGQTLQLYSLTMSEPVFYIGEHPEHVYGLYKLYQKCVTCVH
jgi:hypothetical protein